MQLPAGFPHFVPLLSTVPAEGRRAGWPPCCTDLYLQKGIPDCNLETMGRSFGSTGLVPSAAGYQGAGPTRECLKVKPSQVLSLSWVDSRTRGLTIFLPKRCQTLAQHPHLLPLAFPWYYASDSQEKLQAPCKPKDAACKARGLAQDT